MGNTGVQLGKNYQTFMPAFTDNADIQQAMMMLWYGDPNATAPTGKGIESYFSQLSTRTLILENHKGAQIIYASSSPTRDTDNYSSWLWIDTSKTNPDGASRPVYIWNGTAWSAIAGAASPDLNYSWSGTNTFLKPLTVHGPINSMSSESVRSSTLADATNGTLSFINGRYEFYRDGSWLSLGSSEKTIAQRADQSTNMVLSDADCILQFTYPDNATYTITSNQIRIGSSVYINRNSSKPLTIVAGSGVSILSKNLILGQYATVVMTKVATDTWIMQNAGSSLPPGGVTNQAPLKVDGSDYNIQWVSVVPATGGNFSGAVAMPILNVTQENATNISVSGNQTVNSGSLKIGGHAVFVQNTQPSSASSGDIWIQSV